MKSARVARAGYAAAVVVALFAGWLSYANWQYRFGRISFPKLDEQRFAAERPTRRIDVLPSLASAKNRPLAIDQRGGDVSHLDLRTSAATLRHVARSVPSSTRSL